MPLLSTLLLMMPLIDVRSPLQAKGIDLQKTAVYAAWTDTAEPIADYQGDKLLNPASTLKLATSYCTLKAFGPNHTFSTRYYSESKPKEGQIQNLWIEGRGDPSLVIEELWLHVQSLKEMGIRRINGSLLIDDSYFDSKDYPGRQENNERAYNAKPTGLSLNYNSIASVSGGETVYRAADNPPVFFGQTLKQLLEESGIKMGGEIEKSKVHEGLSLLLEPKSRPLSWTVWGMNKFSNNFIAESLVKQLGVLEMGTPGSTVNGIRKIEHCLSEIGIPKDAFFIENGSGLSYKTQFSAKNLAKVLIAVHNDPKIAPELISSLSLYGVDGTMKKRNGFKALEGSVRAKTGSLNAISSLAGYLPVEGDRVIAFVIMMNGLKTGLWEAQKVQDKVVETLRIWNKKS